MDTAAGPAVAVHLGGAPSRCQGPAELGVSPAMASRGAVTAALRGLPRWGAGGAAMPEPGRGAGGGASAARVGGEPQPYSLGRPPLLVPRVSVGDAMPPASR